MAFYKAMAWHEGEDKIHQLTRVPLFDNPTRPMLSAAAAARVAASPTIALGTVDDQGRVWCTVWGGDVPIAQPISQGGVIGIRTEVDASFDPVVQTLYAGQDDDEIVHPDPKNGKAVSGVSIYLEQRDRVKLFGRMLAGSLSVNSNASTSPDTAPVTDQSRPDGKQGTTGNAQLVLHITQSLGNCPKYLNKKVIKSHPNSRPILLSDSPHLSDAAISHIHSADIFFIASRGPDDMDCNNRGGSPGFIRVQPFSDPSDPDEASVLVWPEYSGNNLYQTLGNLTYDPSCGVVIPNMMTGDVLYLSGKAEILLNKEASSVMTKTRLAVRFVISAARFVRDGLTFRGLPCSDNRDVSSSNPVVSREITDGQSPYNPRIRLLTSELAANAPGSSISTLPPNEYQDRYGTATSNAEPELTATLVAKKQLTPTITRYTFSLASTDPHAFSSDMSPLWTPGQYVALDFSDELYMGYSHMNDADPTSLNDDFVRTFTLSRVFKPPKGSKVEFEVTVRSVGAVTKWLSGQSANSGMTRLSVKGFAGDFRFAPEPTATGTGLHGEKQTRNIFVAAGIGITPLLGQIRPTSADEEGKDVLKGVTVLWTLGVADIGLAVDAIKDMPEGLKTRIRLFVTRSEMEGAGSQNLRALTLLETQGVRVFRRRIAQDDLISLQKDGEGEIENWYVCTAPAMRKQVQDWLGGIPVVFENFDY